MPRRLRLKRSRRREFTGESRRLRSPNTLYANGVTRGSPVPGTPKGNLRSAPISAKCSAWPIPRSRTAFGRVVDRAVARIRRLRSASGIVNYRPEQARTQSVAPQQDPLQKVQFDFAQARRWMPMPGVPTPHRELQKFAVPVVDAHSREILQCDVLQFDRPRELNRSPKYLTGGKKAKAMGTGAKGA
jgi:hypothetical protein